MSEFARIFSPRTDKAIKSISLLANGVRYKPTTDETAHLMDALKNAVNEIAQLYGVLPGSEVVKDAPDVSESRVEASRIDAKVDSLKRGAFAFGDIDANIRSIPEDQVTRYITHMLARMCNKFDEPEAQPKNYKVKETPEV